MGDGIQIFFFFSAISFNFESSETLRRIVLKFCSWTRSFEFLSKYLNTLSRNSSFFFYANI